MLAIKRWEVFYRFYTGNLNKIRFFKMNELCKYNMTVMITE